MNEIIAKLSSYNLFNYLLPGVIFSVLVEKFTVHSFVIESIVAAAFVYYFVGLVISRIGSLVIEPFLRWIKFLEFAEHKNFVIASKNDEKIEILSEQNNTYRTFVSMFFLFLLLKLYDTLRPFCLLTRGFDGYIILSLLVCLFLFSYRKQTKYITSRILLTKK
jgi:hypothetical protein